MHLHSINIISSSAISFYCYIFTYTTCLTSSVVTEHTFSDWQDRGARGCFCSWRGTDEEIKNSDHSICRCSLQNPNDSNEMQTDKVRGGVCKNQESLHNCLYTMKSAYKACTKTKYPYDDESCNNHCQEFLDHIVDRNIDTLNSTIRKINECSDKTGQELYAILEDFQYHAGMGYQGCCEEINGRRYFSWTCSVPQCKKHLETLDVRLSYENIQKMCIHNWDHLVSDRESGYEWKREDNNEVTLHLRNCLRIRELNQLPKAVDNENSKEAEKKIPDDVSLNLSNLLPRTNGFGHYCCQFVPSNELSCRENCQKIFEKPPMTTSAGAQMMAETFDLRCAQKAGMQRASTCVQNVIAGQCRPGCSRMNFCSSFNNQPDFTFRRCTDEADHAASNLYEQWTRHNELSFDHLEEEESSTNSNVNNNYQNDAPVLRIPLKDISNCEPLVFKAVACALTIKPCSRTQSSRICLRDCVRLLSNCGNFSTAEKPNPDPTEEALKRCSLLLAPSSIGGAYDQDESNCVSIYDLSETTGTSGSSALSTAILQSSAENEITYPCSSSNLCRDSSKEVCEISRHNVQTIPAKFSISTVPNKCTKGCSMQQWSMIHMMSLPGDIVISSWDGDASKCIVCRCVPHINPDKTSFFCDIEPQVLRARGCNFHIEKKCPKDAVASRRTSSSAVGAVPAMFDVGAGRVNTDTDFMFECNLCSCLGYKTYCTKRLCLTDYHLASNRQVKYGIEFTGMPNNADSEFLATCASNGRTYPNDEVTKALGFTADQLGACELNQRCYTTTCIDGYKCVVNREVCLSKTYQCVQHKCVKSDDCLQHVCDENGQTHASKCHRDLSSEIAYPTRCDQQCGAKEIVCGTNGHTYSSPCAAFYDRVLVDYRGKCRDFAIQISDTEPRQCYKIGGVEGCAKLPPFCSGVHAFGVCCPICGAVARLILVPELVDMVHLTLTGGPNNTLNPPDQYTVRDVVMAVRQYITLPQCDVFGHLSLDESVTLMFTVPFTNPTPLQVQSCIEESKRIIGLFTKRDVTIISNLHLFPVAGADVDVSFVKFASSQLHSSTTPSSYWLLSITTLSIWYIYINSLLHGSTSIIFSPSSFTSR